MSPSTRKYAFRTLSTVSILLNLAAVYYLYEFGGLRRMFLKMDMTGLAESRKDFQEGLEERYRKLPLEPGEVVFAGDSLIGNGPWADFYGDVHNRGIGGETVEGILGWVDTILRSKPRKIFLLLGTNDLAKAVPVAQYLRNYRTLLERISKESPETKIYVIGALPVNTSFSSKPAQQNETIAEARQLLKGLVAEFPAAKFLDLTPYVVDQAGELRRELSTDGVHLNIEGYLAIRKPLAAFVSEDESRGAHAKAGP